jgi:site-specific recombinase XerD
MAKIRLGKSGNSRTRGHQKQPLLSEEALYLKQQMQSGSSGFIEYLLFKGFSGETIRRYTKDVQGFETWASKENLPVAAVSYADVLHFVQSKRGEVEQSTLSRLVNSLKHYYNHLQASGLVRDNPTSQIKIRGIKRRKLYDVFKIVELEKLYHSYRFEKSEVHQNQNWYTTSELSFKRNKVILGLLIYQGLSAMELSRLTLKDLKLREGKIYVAGSRRSNEREMKLEAAQIMDLMEYSLKTRDAILALEAKQSEQLLVSTGKGHKLNNALQKLVQTLTKINPKVSSLKQIRTSVITHWLKNHNLREVQYMAGHRYVSSTEAYLVNDLDDLLEDVNKYHPIG